ncbi:MAG TPA: hypothetical protein VNI55_05670 [Gaiellaceae bacterium]|nr:hypothetical protein [Gaiellaceae bacterium]
MAAAREVEEIVARETRAWDTQDVQLLLSVFHPDMVWPWPRSYTSHDPADWTLVQGRFDAERWGRGWRDLFDSHELVHNRRRIVRIEVSNEVTERSRSSISTHSGAPASTARSLTGSGGPARPMPASEGTGR